jgi:hypothetical protein
MGAGTGSGWAPVRDFCTQNSWLWALELAGVLLSGLTLKTGYMRGGRQSHSVISLRPCR